MRVPPEQEAEAYYQLFNLVRKVDPEISISAFAGKVGRSPGAIKHALQFCELPAVVRNAVERREVPYGIALELFRIYEKKRNDPDLVEELRWWIMRAITEPATVPDFRQKVSQHLASLESGQQELLNIISEAENLRRLHVRKTVEVHALRALWTYIGYFERVRSLFDQGLLGAADSPFSKRSPRRILRKHIAQLRMMIPHLRRLLPKYGKEAARMEQTMRSSKRLLDEFNDG
jgi:hypothetical protein